MESIFGYGYLKMHMKRKKTPATYRDKLGKIVKTSLDHNFELGAWI
jgi:hypothetical protein